MKSTNLFLSIVLVAGSALAEEIKPREVIDRFLEAESRLLGEFQQYTYSQKILFQELSDFGTVWGQRVVEYEIYFDTAGQRQLRKLYDHGRMRNIRVTKHDLEDAVSRQPFMLTTETASDYEIDYIGKEIVDELSTYVLMWNPGRRKTESATFRVAFSWTTSISWSS